MLSSSLRLATVRDDSVKSPDSVLLLLNLWLRRIVFIITRLRLTLLVLLLLLSLLPLPLDGFSDLGMLHCIIIHVLACDVGVRQHEARDNYQEKADDQEQNFERLVIILNFFLVCEGFFD
mmetsp:Transcript_6421/g.8602  ORF Transcript_6421/g.8602 Transcript_6421/m.8602 type:complete len:120 (-) Transcript_6421:992-1351(-)